MTTGRTRTGRCYARPVSDDEAAPTDPNAETNAEPGDAYDAAAVTWAALLGHWTDFARAALARPDDADGRSLRDSVPDLIQLQAVWFALRELEGLPADEAALGRDRAGVLIERHGGALRRRFGDALPGGMADLIADAERALAAAGGRPDADPAHREQ